MMQPLTIAIDRLVLAERIQLICAHMFAIGDDRVRIVADAGVFGMYGQFDEQYDVLGEYSATGGDFAAILTLYPQPSFPPFDAIQWIRRFCAATPCRALAAPAADSRDAADPARRWLVDEAGGIQRVAVKTQPNGRDFAIAHDGEQLAGRE